MAGEAGWPRQSAPPPAQPPTKRESQLTSSSSTEGAGHRVGRLGRPHGLEGFLGLYLEPEDIVHFDAGATIWINDRPYTVRALRRVDKGLQVAFQGVDDREGAEEIRGAEVMVEGRRALEEGEFWPADLVGLEARSLEGGRIGVVVGVVAGLAQDRLVVESDGSTFEVPFVDDLVPVVDLEKGYVEIVTLPGLIGP
ncbi:MAG TPA: ribosome maturation factor RimM [Acidimicrobiia bacterium]|nr:ribosome maturation factor RimM [Acidimicrobiia bacterium]